MFSFDKSDFQRVAVSGLSALAISATCLFAAAAPVKAATPASVADWTEQVEHRIAAVRVSDARLAPATLRTAEVAVHFTPDGDFAGATLAKSSSLAEVDKGAVKVASRLGYPRLPVSARGSARDVTMRLHFGDAAAGVVAPAGAPRVEVATRGSGIQVAAR